MRSSDHSLNLLSLPILPTSPEYLNRPLWCVTGPLCAPSVFCCMIKTYKEYGPAIWGYSVFKGQPGFRTIGQDLRAWKTAEAECWDNHPRFYATQKAALRRVAELITPVCDVNDKPLMKPPPPLRWKKQRDSDGSITFYASRARPYSTFFCIQIDPRDARNRTMTLAAWVGEQTGEPMLERVVKIAANCALEKALSEEIGIWQNQLIREIADLLQARADYTRSLLSINQP